MRAKRGDQPKREENKMNVFNSIYGSNISEDQMNSYQQMSQLQLESNDTFSLNDDPAQDIRFVDRKQIKFQEQPLEPLKVQQRINVEEQDDEIYYITHNPIKHNRSTYKASEGQYRQKLAELLIEKLEQQARRNNTGSMRPSYKIKRETHESTPGANSQGYQRQVLYI